MNKEALFCDGFGEYVLPPEPCANQEITLRFRTRRDDARHVYLRVAQERHAMKKEMVTPDTKDAFDYYAIRWQLGDTSFAYSFEIHGDEVCYYNTNGAVEDFDTESAFCISPGFATPGWAKGAVMYQIFVDRFYNGDTSNDVQTKEYIYIDGYAKHVADWDKYPAPGVEGVREFYGGDLEGVRQKLDYIKELGVEVIYFNPLFVSPSNHKYDIQDYDYIDPHFGKIVHHAGCVLEEEQKNTQASLYQNRVTNRENLEASNQFFAKLVEEIHARGMKVILDGVFNHCGSFNKWLDREKIYKGKEGYASGAFVSEDSPYQDFFCFDDMQKWPDNTSYVGWWGHETLPKLNYEESKELESYILEIGRKWVSSPYFVDGWRLDVAADLGQSEEYNHAFWKKFRVAVKEANPEALILAEHYGDPKEWLAGDEWDTVMNYDAFMEPVTWFLTGMQKHSDELRLDLLGNATAFWSSMKYHMSRLLPASLQVAMNELSNHDHSRFLTRTNHMVGRIETRGALAANEYVNEAIMRLAVIIQMTWIGAPTVYYGDEAGLCGFTDPDNRRTYPWGRENQELLDFHKKMISMHKEHIALRDGSLKSLVGEQGVIAYGRFCKGEQIIIVVNSSEELKEVTVPVWLAEVPKKALLHRIVYSYQEGITMEEERYFVEAGQVVLNLGAHSAIVLKRSDL